MTESWTLSVGAWEQATSPFSPLPIIEYKKCEVMNWERPGNQARGLPHSQVTSRIYLTAVKKHLMIVLSAFFSTFLRRLKSSMKNWKMKWWVSWADVHWCVGTGGLFVCLLLQDNWRNLEMPSWNRSAFPHKTFSSSKTPRVGGTPLTSRDNALLITMHALMQYNSVASSPSAGSVIPEQHASMCIKPDHLWPSRKVRGSSRCY